MGDLAVIQAVCQTAVARADKRYKNEGRAAADRQVTVLKDDSALTCKNPLWRLVLETPVTCEGQVSSLGVLLGRAQAQPALARRAERLGLWQKAYRAGRIEFEVLWHRAPQVVEWLKINGAMPPTTATSRFKASVPNA